MVNVQRIAKSKTLETTQTIDNQVCLKIKNVVVIIVTYSMNTCMYCVEKIYTPVSTLVKHTEFNMYDSLYLKLPSCEIKWSTHNIII